MNKLISIICLIFLSFSVSSCAEKKVYNDIDKENFVVKFGVFEKNTFKLKEETTQIPLVYKDTGFSYGYVIYAKDKSNFSEYSIAYPPREGVPGTEVKANSINNGLKGPAGKSIKGSIAHKFGFDQGDPAGEWAVDVYVNDNLLQSIEFEVLENN